MTKKSKIFRKNFLVGIDLECSKIYFKTKISILKIFPVEKIFQRPSHFFRKIGDQKIENFSKFFFGHNRFRMVQNVF